jgi:hypothetical protein
MCRWRDPGGQDHTQADEEAPAAWTALGMGIPAITACHLPGQDSWLFYRPLPQLLPTTGQGLTLGRRIQPIGTDDPGAGCRHMQEIPPNKLFDGHAHAPLSGVLPAGPPRSADSRR